MIKLLSALILSLPELLRLVDKILKKIELENQNKRVKDELQKINEAFEKRNSKMLNDAFNGVSDVELREPEGNIGSGEKAKH